MIQITFLDRPFGPGRGPLANNATANIGIFFELAAKNFDFSADFLRISLKLAYFSGSYWCVWR